MAKLTERQARVLAFLIQHKIEHDGASPTRRQIGAWCNITSTSMVDYTLRALERRGLITIGEGARDIRVRGGRWIYQSDPPDEIVKP